MSSRRQRYDDGDSAALVTIAENEDADEKPPMSDNSQNDQKFFDPQGCAQMLDTELLFNPTLIKCCFEYNPSSFSAKYIFLYFSIENTLRDSIKKLSISPGGSRLVQWVEDLISWVRNSHSNGRPGDCRNREGWLMARRGKDYYSDTGRGQAGYGSAENRFRRFLTPRSRSNAEYWTLFQSHSYLT